MTRFPSTVLSLALFGIIFTAPMPAQKKTAPASSDLLSGIPAGRTRVVDLTHALSESNPAWPGDAQPFEAKINATVEMNGYFTRRFSTLEHFGTHMDAPAHFPPGATTVDQLPPERLFGPAVVLDVTAQGKRDPDYRLTRADVGQWEQKHGRIPAGAIVLLRTGWAARWPDADRYRNAGNGKAMRFPGFGVDAVNLLIERKVSGLGCDTMSVDYGASSDFAVHTVSHGAGLYHLENLADLTALPESGAFLVVAPIKLEGGSGGPVRVFALLP
jgi:kynurenine formamidase